MNNVNNNKLTKLCILIIGLINSIPSSSASPVNAGIAGGLNDALAPIVIGVLAGAAIIIIGTATAISRVIYKKHKKKNKNTYKIKNYKSPQKSFYTSKKTWKKHTQEIETLKNVNSQIV